MARSSTSGRNGGGRKKGQLNRATRDVRAAIVKIAEGNVGKVNRWMEQIEDPARKVELFLRLLEYHIPKARTDVNVTISPYEAYVREAEQRGEDLTP